MHQALCRRLLERQARTVNTGPVRARLLRAVELDGTCALVSFRTADRDHLLAFDGPNFTTPSRSPCRRSAPTPGSR